MRTSSLSSCDLESELDYEGWAGDCKEATCSSSLSLPKGRAQKTCQLVWFPLLPAVALVISSSVYLVREVDDYTRKVGHLHDSKDIEAAASCLESIRRIQTLRYTSTLYLSSGLPVPSFARFVDGLFSATSEALWEPETPGEDSSQPCDFSHLIREYFSEINFGQTDVYIDSEELKKFCTLKVFVLETLNQLRHLTVTMQRDAYRRVSSRFNFLVDLLHVDCIKHVDYYGNRIQIVQALERYHALVDLEKVYSRMLSIGAVYYSRGYLGKFERRTMLADLRLADDYSRFSQLNVVVPEMVRLIIAEVLNTDNGQSREKATSFGLARWTKVMQTFIGDLDGLVDEQLAEMKEKVHAERMRIEWHVEFAVCAWVAVFGVMLPIITINATRTIASLRAYGMSCADKEQKLRREKHKTDALLQEMLPRSECFPLFRCNCQSE